MSTKATKNAILDYIAEHHINRPEERRLIGKLSGEETKYWLIQAHILYREMGLEDRDERIAFFHILLDYPIRSTRDLTVGQIKGLKIALLTFHDDVVKMVRDLLIEYDVTRQP